MNELNIKNFIKLWKAEHAATVKVHDLAEKIDNAMTRDTPTERLKNSHALWTGKQNALNTSIITGIKNGEFSQDAVTLCRGKLGTLDGYVCDCYYSMWQDRNLEIEHNKVA
jgi:hypothetical protein